MTETHSHYITPGSHNLKVPSKDEFHRQAMEKLSIADFCTDYFPNPGYKTWKIERSLRWTLSRYNNQVKMKKNRMKELAC